MQARLVHVRILAYCKDAARQDGLQTELMGARDQCSALRARVHPEFGYPFCRDLVDDQDANVWRYIQGSHVDGARNVQDRRVGSESLDLRFVGIDRNDLVSLMPECAYGTVAELPPVSRRTYDGDNLRQDNLPRSL